MKDLRVTIFEDNRILREGLTQLIESDLHEACDYLQIWSLVNLSCL